MKKALITGVSGQDGSYLAEYLLGLGYEVHGIVRRHSVAENQNFRLHALGNNIHTHYGDLNDYPSLVSLVQQIMPDEIYNLAAMSHVRVSFDMPAFTIKTNSLGVLSLLEIYRMFCPESKFYQASSSEMFGNSIDEDGVQRLTTPMNPVSPYGCSKVMGYQLTRHYRNAYNLHATNGILFNHESPRRGSNFVTNKVVKGAVSIKKGMQEKLALGNLDAHRDWGHAKDYVRAMHMITNHETPDDFVVATGITHSVRDLCEIVFAKLGMNYKNFVIQDDRYLRPEELNYLKGDPARAKEILGWKPEYTFETMIDEMISHWEGVL
jgi:GDPmannose 4,6-dehydratase